MIFVISATWEQTHEADVQGLDHHPIKDKSGETLFLLLFWIVLFFLGARA